MSKTWPGLWPLLLLAPLACSIERVARGVGEGEGEGAAEGEGEGPAEGEGEGEGPGEGEGEGPAEGEGEGEGPGEGEGEGAAEGEGEGEGEGPAEGEGEGEEPGCAALRPDPCIAQAGCVLELTSAPDRYLCRRAADACEEIADRDACVATADCGWSPGACYCPGDLDCGCGGGPAPRCEVPPTGCGTRVTVRSDGGLCMEGACFRRTELVGTGWLVHDDETAATPVYGKLSGEPLWLVDALLRELDPGALQDGYGDCCNSHFDGSDTYVAFFEGGVQTREVRVSDQNLAPARLGRLIETLASAGVALVEQGDGSRCEP